MHLIIHSLRLFHLFVVVVLFCGLDFVFSESGDKPISEHSTRKKSDDITDMLATGKILLNPTRVPELETSRKKIEEKLSVELDKWRLLPEDCGRRVFTPVETVGLRILGGSEAQKGEYPWLANIFYSGLMWHYNSPQCGGAILNEKYILTAGHCCKLQRPPLRVRVGAVNLYSGNECPFGSRCLPTKQDIAVESFSVHPALNVSYVYGYAHDDICILRLQQNIRFNDAVKPICLPKDNVQKMNLTDKVTEFAGWGATYTENIAPSLQKTEMTVISAEKCFEDLNPLVRHDEIKEFCTEGQDKICYGDSGSPLVKSISVGGVDRYYILGIASYSTENLGSDCLDNAPMVFVKVSHYIDWILDHIKP